MIWLFMRIPAAFLPDEDQGVIFAQVQTPVGSSAERTQKVIDDMRSFLLNDKEGEPGEGKGVKSVFTVNGFNFAGRGQSSGLAFVMLKPWGERDASQLGVRNRQARPGLLHADLPGRHGICHRAAFGTGAG